MTADAKRLLEAALRLPDAERAELAAILADSISDGVPEAEIEAAWLAEARRRLEDIHSGRSKAVPWKQVDGKLRAMLDAARNRPAPTG